MQTDIDAELCEDIQDALDVYASSGRLENVVLPFTHPTFDLALDRIRWRIGRTLGQAQARFHAELRDLASRDIDGHQETLAYLLVSGTGARVARCLADAHAPSASIHRLTRGAPSASFRYARYALEAMSIANLSPGQIGRIGQQFYDPTWRFGDYQPIALAPSRGSGDLRVLVTARRPLRPHGAPAQPANTRFADLTRDPCATGWDSPRERTRGYPLYPDGALQVELHHSWSDLAIATAVETVRVALMDAAPDLQWDLAQGRARLIGMTRPDGDGVEITAVGTTQESEAILVPHGLIAHNRYRFDQALLELAPLKMDGQTVC